MAEPATGRGPPRPSLQLLGGAGAGVLVVAAVVGVAAARHSRALAAVKPRRGRRCRDFGVIRVRPTMAGDLSHGSLDGRAPKQHERNLGARRASVGREARALSRIGADIESHSLRRSSARGGQGTNCSASWPILCLAEPALGLRWRHERRQEALRLGPGAPDATRRGRAGAGLPVRDARRAPADPRRRAAADRRARSAISASATGPRAWWTGSRWTSSRLAAGGHRHRTRDSTVGCRIWPAGGRDRIRRDLLTASSVIYAWASDRGAYGWPPGSPSQAPKRAIEASTPCPGRAELPRGAGPGLRPRRGGAWTGSVRAHYELAPGCRPLRGGGHRPAAHARPGHSPLPDLPKALAMIRRGPHCADLGRDAAPCACVGTLGRLQPGARPGVSRELGT